MLMLPSNHNFQSKQASGADPEPPGGINTWSHIRSCPPTGGELRDLLHFMNVTLQRGDREPDPEPEPESEGSNENKHK